MIKILLILIFMTGAVYAGSSVTRNWAIPAPPSKYIDSNSYYDYLNFLYNHFNTVQIVTTNPNGTARQQAGNFLMYNNSGTFKLCFETDQPSGTTWKCANLT